MNHAVLRWHAIRERLDARFRSQRLAEEFCRGLENDCVVLDLASGTGNNLRYLQPWLPPNCCRVRVDCDRELLDQYLHSTNPIPTAVGGEAARDIQCVVDLASNFRRLPNQVDTVIVCNAFFDIASRDWSSALFQHLNARRVLISMSLSGAITWHPHSPVDEQIAALQRVHQTSDQGFGEAMGPETPEHLVQVFADQVYQVSVAASDWKLDSETENDVCRMLVHGIARRVRGILQRDSGMQRIDSQILDHWESERLQQIASECLRVVVPHQDILAMRDA